MAKQPEDRFQMELAKAQADLDEAYIRIADLEAARKEQAVELERVKAKGVTTEQPWRETLLRILWQAQRITPGATHKEILVLFPKLRQWVDEGGGVGCAERLEQQWRKGGG